MKKHLPWHHTRIGTTVLWLGSIEVAVPVLALTAIALAVGTYLDSTKGAKVAREAVYGSWWFIATMALVSVSLTFAVFTRFPWKRRHVGFITVHAGLLGLIAGGFVSLFERVEGHLPLEEGKTSNVMETQDEQVELVQHDAGQFSVLGTSPAPNGPTTLTMGGTRIQVVEHWANSHDEQVVNDDAPMPFRAVLIAAQQGEEPIWVGEEGKAGEPPLLAELLVRVLPDGGTWEPPAKAAPAAPAAQEYAFVVDGKPYPVRDEGQEVLPGWKIVSIKRYTRAFVGSDGLIEVAGGPENPAIDVAITDGKGTTERHTAFQNFADMVMNRAVEGVAHFAKLGPAQVASPSSTETLIVFGTIAQTGIGYISPTGEARVLDAAAAFPKTYDLGMRRVSIARQFARAKGGWKTLRAEPGKDNRPALLVRTSDSTDLTIVPFKGMVPITAGDRPLLLRFGPKTVTLPFSVQLVKFRKTDYPGTEMAMAYESDVEVTLPGKEAAAPFRIYMNHPYARGPWKVYQSGFVGESISIFSIMRDPGLPLTYASSALLCMGILITFFSRSLSWGHPGIPVAELSKEPRHVSPVSAAPAPGPVVVLNRPVSAGGV